MEQNYKDALIVNSSGTIYRYWVDGGGRVQRSRVFSISKHKNTEVNEMYVFDDYALALVNGNSFRVIFFKDFRNLDVPENYSIELFSKDSMSQSLMMLASDNKTPELYITVKS